MPALGVHSMPTSIEVLYEILDMLTWCCGDRLFDDRFDFLSRPVSWLEPASAR
jgi:hypothetical protein